MAGTQHEKWVEIQNGEIFCGAQVQLYIAGGSEGDAPIRSLRGLQRIHLKACESGAVKFTVAAEDVPKEKVEIIAGGGQPVGSTPHVNGLL